MAAQVPHRGKEKRLSLGTWPEIGLKEARERREEARRQLTLRVNPGVLRKAQLHKAHWAAQEAIDTLSFEVVAREWQAKHAPSWAASHACKILRRLELEVFPWVKALPISYIGAPICWPWRGTSMIAASLVPGRMECDMASNL